MVNNFNFLRFLKGLISKYEPHEEGVGSRVERELQRVGFKHGIAKPTEEIEGLSKFKAVARTEQGLVLHLLSTGGPHSAVDLPKVTPSSTEPQSPATDHVNQPTIASLPPTLSLPVPEFVTESATEFITENTNNNNNNNSIEMKPTPTTTTFNKTPSTTNAKNTKESTAPPKSTLSQVNKKSGKSETLVSPPHEEEHGMARLRRLWRQQEDLGDIKILIEGEEHSPRAQKMISNMTGKKLQKQFLELYRALLLLDSFAQLNYDAIAKFLKKHDKNLGIKLKSTYLKTLATKGFVNREILRLLVSETEV